MPRDHRGFRRALVHDESDGLTINFNNDYPGGVTVGGVRELDVVGNLHFRTVNPNDPLNTETVALGEVIATLSGPGHNYGDAPRPARRPPRKARGGRIPGVFDRRATPRGGMHRRSNAAVIMPGTTKATDQRFAGSNHGARGQALETPLISPIVRRHDPGHSGSARASRPGVPVHAAATRRARPAPPPSLKMV